MFKQVFKLIAQQIDAVVNKALKKIGQIARKAGMWKTDVAWDGTLQFYCLDLRAFSFTMTYIVDPSGGFHSKFEWSRGSKPWRELWDETTAMQRQVIFDWAFTASLDELQNAVDRHERLVKAAEESNLWEIRGAVLCSLPVKRQAQIELGRRERKAALAERMFG